MIYLDNRQNKIEVDEKFIKEMEEVILFALKEEEVLKDCEISLVLVDNNEIKDINRETRGIDKITDVLSFPMLDYEKGKVFKDIYKNFEFDEVYLDGEDLVLGDIVLCLERALEQSKEYNHSFERESFYLIVHSILHLLGYDHMEEEEKKIMRKREEEILEKLDIRR
ncbi:rRNA maturation RNase YbeY [uncultured Clostridium sp.]|uniref:rRNA maturation RNase YbeY n=1 Tax=uncultured Clostridium sp. TaxID=59620 RepID=UPI00261859C0|nr:rRNA maturation RNase YbeY [uncultured Clostridium sp.]